MQEIKLCSVEGCERAFSAKGLCKSHYNSARKVPNCIVENCKNKKKNKGYCQQHYSNLKNYGDPLYFKKIKEKQKYLKNHISYSSHRAMLWRVSPKNKTSKHNYFDRGITICERWLGKTGLENFINDMGEKPSKNHSLDRKDNDKGYSPENCRWATDTEQSRNRRVTKKVIYEGREISVSELAEKNGYDANNIRRRLKYGYSIEKAISQPKKTPIMIEKNGITKNITEWGYFYGFNIPWATIQLKKGKTLEDIIEASMKHGFKGRTKGKGRTLTEEQIKLRKEAISKDINHDGKRI